LPAEIPQNYQLVLEAAKSKGFDGVKVLIIGAPGSGKTLSLKTLKQGGSNENNND
jgi:Holliday junction resolvasome RuvABC ATP-dependent DNA helicase subunit